MTPVNEAIAAIEPWHARPEPSGLAPSVVNPGNVVPFVRPLHRETIEKVSPLVIVSGERPAPVSHERERVAWWLLFIVISLFIHGSVYAALREQPRLQTSLGVIAITVEMVIGADQSAGLAEVRPDIKDNTVAARDTEQAKSKAPEQPLVERDELDITASVPVVPTDKMHKKETAPVEKEHVRATSRPRTRMASRSSSPSGGVDRGRSAADSSYAGQVAAHLARHKQYPAQAQQRGNEGVAAVTFSLDGAGRVTSVRLARGSGIASIDQEAIALPRRASPFPAPPHGRPVNFTVPVSFRLH